MMQYLLALITGLIVGIVFRLTKLPIPAPTQLEGILGVFGIFLGYLLVRLLIK